MMRELVIVGAGGLGREVAWTVERINASALEPVWNIIGFADDDVSLHGRSVSGVQVLGNTREILANHANAAVVLAVGSNAIRARLVAELNEREFPSIVDPSAIVAPSARLGRGTFVAPFALVSCDAVVGEFVIVNARAGIGHDTVVGDFTSICPGVSLSGNTRLGRAVTMGTNSCTVPGRTIGDSATVAAGVSVLTDLAPGATLSPFGTFRAAANSQG